MKGLELPINALIIIVVAVIVMIALIAMFYPAFLSGSSTVTLETAKSQACKALVEGNNCNTTQAVLWNIYVYGFDADKDGTNNPGPNTGANCQTSTSQDNLYMLCKCHFQIDPATDASSCRKLCGCNA